MGHKEKLKTLDLSELLNRAQDLNRDKPEFISTKSKKYYSSRDVMTYHFETLYSLMDWIDYKSIHKKRKKLKKKLRKIIHQINESDEYISDIIGVS